MSTITISSSLQDVFDNNVPELTDLDTVNINMSPLTTAVESLTGAIGLVGFDLDDFIEDCKVASDNCDPNDYYDYDGFAIVITFTDTLATNASIYWGFCIEDKTCIIVDPTYNDYDFTQLVLPTNLAQNNPPES